MQGRYFLLQDNDFLHIIQGYRKELSCKRYKCKCKLYKSTSLYLILINHSARISEKSTIQSTRYNFLKDRRTEARRDDR